MPPYRELLTRLVHLALDRYQQRQALERGYSS